MGVMRPNNNSTKVCFVYFCFYSFPIRAGPREQARSAEFISSLPCGAQKRQNPAREVLALRDVASAILREKHFGLRHLLFFCSEF